jgi:hypothetical protein
MTWYAFQGWEWTSGPNKGKLKVYNLTGIDNLDLEATGAHGYPTEAIALAKPNAFPGTDQEALLALYSAQAAVPIGSGVIGAQAPTPSATTALNDVFHGLNLQTLLVRLGEILIGLVLIGVGLAKITDAVPVATAVAAKLA